MKLLAAYRAHVPAHRALELERGPTEHTLSTLVANGRERWRQLPLSDEDFITFLARSLPPAVLTTESKAADLWLVCACIHDYPDAWNILENQYLPRAKRLLRRMGNSPDIIEDILQELRRKIVEMSCPATDEAGYSGRGDLAGWLCIVAVHAANRRHVLEQRETTLESSPTLMLPSTDVDPEMAFLQKEYRQELLAAFKEAIASLTARERNLLRLYFLDSLSIDQLAGLYGVHRVTASRWVNQVRDSVALRTREYLARQITLSEAGFQRVLGLIASQIRPNIEAAVAECSTPTG